jgi:hypothetical protein
LARSKKMADVDINGDVPLLDARWEIIAQERAKGSTMAEARRAAGQDYGLGAKTISAEWKPRLEARVGYLVQQSQMLAKARDKSQLVTDEWCVNKLKDLVDDTEIPPAVRVAALREIRQFKHEVNQDAKDVRHLTARIVEAVSHTKGGFVYEDKGAVRTIDVVKAEAAIEAEMDGYDPVREAERTGREALEDTLTEAAEGA